MTPVRRLMLTALPGRLQALNAALVLYDQQLKRLLVTRNRALDQHRIAVGSRPRLQRWQVGGHGFSCA